MAAISTIKIQRKKLEKLKRNTNREPKEIVKSDNATELKEAGFFCLKEAISIHH